MFCKLHLCIISSLWLIHAFVFSTKTWFKNQLQAFNTYQSVTCMFSLNPSRLTYCLGVMTQPPGRATASGGRACSAFTGTGNIKTLLFLDTYLRLDLTTVICVSQRLLLSYYLWCLKIWKNNTTSRFTLCNTTYFH